MRNQLLSSVFLPSASHRASRTIHRFAFLLAVSLLLSFSSSLRAQWSPLATTFNDTIRVLKFNDAASAPRVSGVPQNGYLSDGMDIQFTKNEGSTWTPSTITNTSSWTSGWVTDFAWVDANTGFAAVYGATLPPASGVLLTTDAGSTWNFITGAPTNCRGIYYNATSGLLLVSSQDSGLMKSTDQGTTWTRADTAKYYTGFAFSDASNGIVATDGSGCFGPFNWWKRTTDGGNTWTRTNTYYESWQPMAVAGTPRYFGAHNNTCATIQPCVGGVQESDSYGYGFFPQAAFCLDTMTESMAGDACAMFAAVEYDSIGGGGMWFSVDDGKNWAPLGSKTSSPFPNVDTRFYVSPTKVWSFQYKIVYTATRPTSPDIHIWPDTINFRTAGCFRIDTMVHVFGCNCATNPSLVGDSIVPLGNIATDTFSAVLTTPFPLCAPAVPSLPVSTSIDIQYRPTTPSSDAADYHFHFTRNGVPVDTIVHVTGAGVASKITAVPNKINIREPACTQLDTVLQICNQSCCENMQVDGFDVTGDQCIIQLLAPSTPFRLGPGDCADVHVYFAGTLRRTPGQAPSIGVNVRARCDTTFVGTSFSVTGVTTTTVGVTLRGFNENVKDCCSIHDSAVYFLNTTCDTIILQGIDVTGPQGSYFQIDSLGSKPPLHFPIKIGPYNLLKIPVLIPKCDPGQHNATFTFHFNVGTTGTQCASVEHFDTSISVSFNVQNAITYEGAVSPSKIEFGGVSCCDSSQTRTLKISPVCVPLTLTKIQLTGASNFQMVSGPTLPFSLKPGHDTAITIRYIPCSCTGSDQDNTGSIVLTYAEDTKGPQIIGMHAHCITGVVASIGGPDTLALGTIRYCDSNCIRGTILNTSCTPGLIRLLTGPTHAAFRVTLDNDTIRAKDSLHFTVCLKPQSLSDTTVNGASDTDQITFGVTSTGGQEAPSTSFTVIGKILPPSIVSNVLPTALAANPCGDTDLTFTVANGGDCLPFIIQTFAAGSGVSLASPTLPVTINTGSNQVFTVHFTGTVGQTLSGTITLTDISGRTITEPYSVTFRDCSTHQVTTFTLGPQPLDSNYSTPRCVILKKTYTITANNGTVIVNNVSLAGGSKFSLSGFTGPVTLTSGQSIQITLQYNPDATGSDNDILTINTDHGTVTLHLIGVTTGSQYNIHLGLALDASSNAMPIRVDGVQQAVFKIINVEPIPAGTGATDLTIQLQYPTGILTRNKPIQSVATAADQSTSATGPMVIKITGIPNTGLPANSDLATVTMVPSISNTDQGTVSIGQSAFNQSDPNFGRCSMSAQSAGDVVPVRLNLTCSDSIMMIALQGKLQPMQGIEVIPNPAHKGSSAATLKFTTNLEANVSVDVVDLLGASVSQIANGPMEKGEHTLSIPTQNMSEGTYFARITMNGYTVIRKFILQKD